jgi:hypothetical protein
VFPNGTKYSFITNNIYCSIYFLLSLFTISNNNKKKKTQDNAIITFYLNEKDKVKKLTTLETMLAHNASSPLKYIHFEVLLLPF